MELKWIRMILGIVGVLIVSYEVMRLTGCFCFLGNHGKIIHVDNVGFPGFPSGQCKHCKQVMFYNVMSRQWLEDPNYDKDVNVRTGEVWNHG